MAFTHLPISACRVAVCYILSLLSDNACMLNDNVVADDTLGLSMSMSHLKPQSVFIPHIALSILCIHAFSPSFCFYFRLFSGFFLIQSIMSVKI